MSRLAPRLLGAAGGAGLILAAPGVVAAHQLAAVFQSRLPLAVYLSGAAAAVALSFAFVLVRDVRAAPPADDGRRSRPPRVLTATLQAIGLLALLWIAVQTVLGGDSDAEVPRLFAWVYGWVGVAIVCALVGPVWHWLDPFSTLHDVLARGLAVLGVEGVAPAAYPAAVGRWPAVAGFAAVVWLELVVSGGGPRTLGFVIVGYTLYTLAMMAQFGRDTWRANGEIFSVWFGLLGRLAPFAVGDDGRLRRRGFASGLLEGGWALPDVVLIALGTGSILFDGLSQTVIWVHIFGLPATLPQTLLLAAFLGLIVVAALLVARLVGVAATSAGLLPIAVGYLIAHYLTYLLIDGQRIVVAISDPFQRGWDIFGTAFFEPSGTWLPPGLVWTAQLFAVVGGHMLGAWAGHVVAARTALEAAAAAGNATRRGSQRRARGGEPATAVAPRGAAASTRELRIRQLPLAVVMVGLTTLTLWSLGQALFISAPA